MASTKLASSTVSPASAKARRIPGGKGPAARCHQLAKAALCLLQPGQLTPAAGNKGKARPQTAWPGRDASREALPLGEEHCPALPLGEEHCPPWEGTDRHQNQHSHCPKHGRMEGVWHTGTHIRHKSEHSPCTPAVCPVLWSLQGMQKDQAGWYPCRAQPQEQLLAEPAVLTQIPAFQGEFSFSTRTGGKWQIYCHSILQ